MPQERFERATPFATELRDRLRYRDRFGDRAPMLDPVGQSTFEGEAFLRGMLEGLGFGIVGAFPAA